MAAWIQGKVVGHQRWDDKLHTLFIEAAIEPNQAGQFVKVGLEIDGEIIGRPYSLVNAPRQPPLEIYFIHVPEGQLTPRLIALEAGDDILVSPRANGFMVLDEIPQARHLWLVATGTGVGPFLALLDDGKVWDRFERVMLVYAVRTLSELSYQERIAAIVAAYPDRFAFIPFISREPSDFALPGRIPQAMENGALEARAQATISAEDSQFVLCGNPAMVEDVTQCLVGRGLKKHRRRDPGQITTETYW
jgi:ferredoxin/flavodoxin---NADP+ reductase